MTALWLAAAIFGLLLLVFLMIAGVPKRDSAILLAGISHPRPLLPTVGTFCATAGITGYLTRQSFGKETLIQIGVVLTVAALSAAFARWIVVRAFATPSQNPEDDPQFRFQGTVARVTRAIEGTSAGRVVFDVDGHRYDLRARSLDGLPVAADTEVVIERIDEDLAIVELWASVEQRL